MSRREDFDNALWSDPDFLALSPEGRMTYIWSWTNQRCGMAGIYKVAPASAALETGYSVDAVLAALAELAASDFAYYERNVLWVRTRARKLRTKSEQIAKSVRSDLQKIADDHPLKVRFMEMYEAMPWLRPFLSEGRASLDGTSPEPQPNPQGQPDPASLTRASTEPQSRFSGNGTGKGSGRGSSLTSQDHASARRRIFEVWIEATGKTDRTLLDAKRRKLIDKALDAYPEQDVLDAVTGWRHSPHHRGENDSGTVYNDLELLLRDPANIERFRDYERKPPTPIRPQTKGRATAEDFYAEIGRGA